MASLIMNNGKECELLFSGNIVKETLCKDREFSSGISYGSGAEGVIGSYCKDLDDNFKTRLHYFIDGEVKKQ